jgi:hypothetical protein
MTEPEPEPETDACAMISRCHRHQYPHEYGRVYLYPLWTLADAIGVAPMIVDRDPDPMGASWVADPWHCRVVAPGDGGDA